MKKYSRKRLDDMFANYDTVIVDFIKQSGERRIMNCTRKAHLIPESKNESSGKRIVPDDVYVVFDVEKQDWRSFKIDSVQELLLDIEIDEDVVTKMVEANIAYYNEEVKTYILTEEGAARLLEVIGGDSGNK